ncbi:MAG: hypothetical protein H0W88_04680 [Parachlamydiaceae bacterium]|nr:hypothetical protein [Parachlamydiaceae bacterium]
MIEKMIAQIKKYLPLKIAEIVWDGTIFQMYGTNWNFTTLSAWRISTKDYIEIGCFDKNSIDLVNELKELTISEISLQDERLKIDPVFHLSNGQKIEIFSTDTYEPWTFKVNDLDLFVATPSSPQSFNRSSNQKIE